MGRRPWGHHVPSRSCTQVGCLTSRVIWALATFTAHALAVQTVVSGAPPAKTDARHSCSRDSLGGGLCSCCTP